MLQLLDKLTAFKRELDDQTNDLGSKGEFSKACSVSFQGDRIQRLIDELIEVDEIMSNHIISNS